MIFPNKKHAQRGFTIVELLIVIVVIGILAALVVTTYAGIQGKARDSKRQTDLQAIQNQVETFYASNNYYPSLADLNSSTWRTANGMKTLSTDSLTDPSSKSSTLSGSAASSTNKNVYGYVATANGSACTTAGSQCDSYTLTSYLENNSVYTKTAQD